MEGKPTGPSEPGAPREQGPGAVAASDDTERFGLVELVRQVKEDGRALLVYRRAADR